MSRLGAQGRPAGERTAGAAEVSHLHALERLTRATEPAPGSCERCQLLPDGCNFRPSKQTSPGCPAPSQHGTLCARSLPPNPHVENNRPLPGLGKRIS